MTTSKTTSLTRAERVNADITALLRARNTLLWIVTPEEVRVERAIIEAAAAAKYTTLLWDCATGVSEATGRVRTPNGDPGAVLSMIKDSPERAVYVLRDFHKWLDPVTLRGLRSRARELQSAPPQQARAIVVLSPSADIPPELAGCATVINYPIPDRAEMGKILDAVIATLPEELRVGVAANGTREASIDAAVGLTAEEATNCYARSLVTSRTIDPVLVAGEKKRVIAREKVLTWYDPDPRGLDGVGGLDVLKDWLATRKVAFSEKARAYGLPAPKGCMIVGLPGTGKSLTAKCIATSWSMPLLRLDLGALKSKYVGECHSDDTEFLTEHGMRRFDDIGPDVKLATFNISTGALEYQLPTKRHEHDYDGPMCLIRGRSLLVTPNHRIVAKRPTGNGLTDWYFANADQAFSLSNVRIPVAPSSVAESAPDIFTVPEQAVRHGRGAAVSIPTVEMMELFGYFVADGSTNNVGNRGTVRITQQEGPLADRMLYLLSRFGPAKAHGCDERSDPPIRQLHVQSIPLWCYLRDVCGIGHDNKRLPSWVLRASKPQLQVLWDALMKTDGSQDARGYPSMSYSTTSFVLAEQVQEIAFRLGMRVTCRRTSPGAPRKPLFIVSVTPKDYFQPHHIDQIHYQGRVVCFSVPNGTLITRRDGRWAISGNSEANIRKALQVAEAVSPCILWLDEIEKALAGSTGEQGDGGVSADALGAVLSWMQERQGSVFVVATANDVRALPPELLRKGRFDEVFWVDLPTVKERGEILRAALGQHGRTTEGINLGLLAESTEGFTGAELAALVPDALFDSFADGERAIETRDLLKAANTVVPLSKTAAEKIEGLRAWAKGRARPASTPQETVTSTVRALDL